MNLPFTHDQFLDVFASYNAALWPGAAVLWLLTLAALLLLAKGRLGPRLAGGLLAVHWAWAGIAYHFAFFAAINPAARLFGALFVLQAVLFLWFGVRHPDLQVAWGTRSHQVLSLVFCVYALAYPLLALASGLHWPRLPSFGVPCPSTLLTVGLLLGLPPRRLRGLSVIPWLWCLVAGSAALALGILPDLMLWAGAVVLGLYVAAPNLLAGSRAA
jgi:hypothetical protein